jgi:hypothetical protein
MSLIYDLVVATFFKLGMPPPIDVWETLLIEDGIFIGHKYRCDGGYAIWASGWSAIEFYDEDGKLMKKVAVKRDLRSSA